MNGLAYSLVLMSRILKDAREECGVAADPIGALQVFIIPCPARQHRSGSFRPPVGLAPQFWLN